jgi:hypothetical protein
MMSITSTAGPMSHFDANWNETSITGIRDDGAHSLTMDDVQAGYDTVRWYTSPFTNVNSAVASVPPEVALTGTAVGLRRKKALSFSPRVREKMWRRTRLCKISPELVVTKMI